MIWRMQSKTPESKDFRSSWVVDNKSGWCFDNVIYTYSCWRVNVDHVIINCEVNDSVLQLSARIKFFTLREGLSNDGHKISMHELPAWYTCIRSENQVCEPEMFRTYLKGYVEILMTWTSISWWMSIKLNSSAQKSWVIRSSLN